ncbi:MAG: hypothetical protein UV63_C0019G0004 [Microgenomates group bacterium GW2011_GWC1_43_11]|uniref:Uncharacterized protein n=1 Tax=Candidatus Gottesmanbacteria bacterium GW2011_GWB1_44_11c TaxID=1618447 RepID=A0A0G1GUX6_9BACT|nr:MAG: hypothetical protein UV63_C0019G0004 [Microgenomates group bacterium GW2011_GWC1_43_11]KKT38901.1 MAG: hypothetical protein UW22_C0004G0031 [Candidatus Gottesmanbacteria bacterium GW2011_GWB1_44_11c]HCM82482.1 hypothetical protein [Patescibacteria group bacterium]
MEQRPQQFHQNPEVRFFERELPRVNLEFAHKKKPSGLKKERRKGKLPNEIRHDQNAAIAVGTWKKRGKEKIKTK